jgi:4-hydroxybenzoate polyprenyltransferase
MTTPQPPSTATTLLAYIRLPHFVPIVTVLSATAALALVIAGDELHTGELIRLLLAMLGGQVVVGVVNEVVDAEADGLTKPEKPIPAGLVSRRGAVALGVAGLGLMVAAGATFGWQSLGLLAVGTGLGVAYSLWFKRTRLAWLPYLLALPLLPVWVAVSLDRFDAALLALYPLGAMGVLAVQIAQSVPDVEADRRAGFESLTTKLGERRSLLVCWGALLGSLALAAVVAGVSDVDDRWMAVAAAVLTGAVAFNALIYHRSERTGVMLAFPCAAVSIGALALAWVGGVVSG